MENKDIASAKRTIDKEVEALRMMEGELDDTLSKALDVMQNAKGRVIITGMGKSGHIGSKIAATLASTGTPSFFVHPGEASHGDLGMLTTDDVVVAISNSGETRELSDIILYCKRYGIPLISITKNPNSTLGKTGDILLKLPDDGEACPLGLAPHPLQPQHWFWAIFWQSACWNAKAFPKPTFVSATPAASLAHSFRKFPT